MALGADLSTLPKAYPWSILSSLAWKESSEGRPYYPLIQSRSCKHKHAPWSSYLKKMLHWEKSTTCCSWHREVPSQMHPIRMYLAGRNPHSRLCRIHLREDSTTTLLKILFSWCSLRIIQVYNNCVRKWNDQQATYPTGLYRWVPFRSRAKLSSKLLRSPTCR